MSMLPTIVINNIEIPIHAIHDFTQTYEDFGGFDVLRRLNGSGLGQLNWSKLRTTISGSGTIPAGISGLTPHVAHTIACAVRRSIHSSGAVVTIPATRRADGRHAPIGYAWKPGNDPKNLADGLVETPILSLVANVATLQAVVGAQGYVVTYCPLISAFVTTSENVDLRQAVYSWELTAEEA